MESFELNHLLLVKGKPGLWKFIGFIHNTNMVRIQNLMDENKSYTIKNKDVQLLNNFNICYSDGSKKSLEKVFGFISIVEDKGIVTKEELNTFDTLSVPDKELLMEKLVPNYDKLQFKHYHLSKVIKWYNEITQALDLLEIEDSENENFEMKQEENENI